MANKIFLSPEGYIYEVYDGDQDSATVAQVVKETEVLMQERQKAGLPVNIMVDIRNVGREDLGARRTGAKAMKEWQYDKIAMFGANNYLRHVANLVILAVGKGDKVKMFDTEQAAKEWFSQP